MHGRFPIFLWGNACPGCPPTVHAYANTSLEEEALATWHAAMQN